mmetsp:Transcript_17315/g.18776  ORF Transcript_17315/g.18776 Transcript_17315/m.18776 type:complete len:862 (+) Transcript_17315:37-2622(+)
MADKFDPSQQVTLKDANHQKKEKEYGISFDQIEDFINLHGGRDCFLGRTTSDLIRWIKEDTYADKQSYVAKLQKENPLLVKEANVFISHAWNANFLEELEIIKQHFEEERKRGEKEPILWFDIFTVSQHSESASQKYEDWEMKFMHAIDSCGRVVQVHYPTFHPYLYYRSWCKLEYFYAKSREPDIVFEIAIDKTLLDKHGESCFFDFLMALSVLRSVAFFNHTTCSKRSDDAKITRYVQAHFQEKQIFEMISSYLKFADNIFKTFSNASQHFTKVKRFLVGDVSTFDPLTILNEFSDDSVEYLFVLAYFVRSKDYDQVLSIEIIKKFEEVFKDSEFGRFFCIISKFGSYYFNKERQRIGHNNSDCIPCEEFLYCEKICQDLLITEKGEYFPMMNIGAQALIKYYVQAQQLHLAKKYFLHFQQMKRNSASAKHKYILAEETSFEFDHEVILSNATSTPDSLFERYFKYKPLMTPVQIKILNGRNIDEISMIFQNLLQHTCFTYLDDYDLLEKELDDLFNKFQSVNGFTPCESYVKGFKSIMSVACRAYDEMVSKKIQVNAYDSCWEKILDLNENKMIPEYNLPRILKNSYLVLLLKEKNDDHISENIFPRVREEVFLLFSDFIPSLNDISQESPIIALFEFYIRRHFKSEDEDEVEDEDDLIPLRELYSECIEKIQELADTSSCINETAFSYWYTLLFHLNLIIEKNIDLLERVLPKIFQMAYHIVEELYCRCYDGIIANIKTSSHHPSNHQMNEKDYGCWITLLFTLNNHVKNISFYSSIMVGKIIEVIRCLQEGDYDSYDKKVVKPLIKQLLPTFEVREACYQYQIERIDASLDINERLEELNKLRSFYLLSTGEHEEY